MKKNKYKILVLSDLKETTSTILKSAISLSKIVDADLQFFYVKKPIDIVEQENQLSAMRTISHEYTATKKTIQNLLNPFLVDYGVTINYAVAFGNVKHEISTYMEDYQPDMIVIGKRKSKAINFIGDNITDFILKKHEGAVMIAANENALEPNEKLSLGLLNGAEQPLNIRFADDLMKHIQEPLKLFKIIDNSSSLKQINTHTNKQIVEYVFENDENSIKNLSNYLSKKNINLLYVDRDKKSADNTERNLDIEDVITKLNVSLLLAGTQKPYLHQ